SGSRSGARAADTPRYAASASLSSMFSPSVLASRAHNWLEPRRSTGRERATKTPPLGPRRITIRPSLTRSFRAVSSVGADTPYSFNRSDFSPRRSPGSNSPEAMRSSMARRMASGASTVGLARMAMPWTRDLGSEDSGAPPGSEYTNGPDQGLGGAFRPGFHSPERV